jgi:MFS family permease
MRERLIGSSWRALFAPQLALPLSVLLGGVLLHSMNVLITATLLPSIVADVGGSNLMSWPTTAFVASSIVAATSTAIVSRAVGNRRAFCGGAVIYAAGAILCALAPSIGLVIAGRFVQGLGGGCYPRWHTSWCAMYFRRLFGHGSLACSQASGRFPCRQVL